jgi:hypothetical protein
MKANGWLRVSREEAMDLAKKKKNVEEFEPSRWKRVSPVPKAGLEKRLVSAESYLIARWTWLLHFRKQLRPYAIAGGSLLCFFGSPSYRLLRQKKLVQ